MTTRFHFRRAAGLAALLIGTFSLVTVWAADAPATQPWTAPAREARKANPVASDNASIAAGKALYTKHCLSCHGATGVGNGPAAKDLEKSPGDLSKPVMWDQTDGAIFWKLSTGKKPMPTFDTLTSETERWQIINYVRTLAPKPAATSSQPAGK
jgi:mono/diheme cytochrome c family protein